MSECSDQLVAASGATGRPRASATIPTDEARSGGRRVAFAGQSDGGEVLLAAAYSRRDRGTDARS